MSPNEHIAADESATLRDRIAAVRSRIALACAGVGRDPDDVRLLPVTKTIPAERLRAAIACGLTEFGENKVQEARAKAEILSDLGPRWSIVGHLQSNKAKHVARFADEFQALDSLKVAQALHHRLTLEGRSMDVFVQVNTSGEASKFGLEPAAVRAFIAELPRYSALRCRGLMTLALLSEHGPAVRACFKRLRDLRDELRNYAPDSVQLEGLSMGMSGDFETAVEEGATVVRVGQAIFGPRPLPASHYWPQPRNVSQEPKS